MESLFINGKWEDDLIYSLIEKDWEKIGKDREKIHLTHN